MITIIGASVADITGKLDSKLILQDSNPGTVHISAGGVGRNITENLVSLNCDVNFISAFGNDAFADFLIQNCNKSNINIENSYFGTIDSTALYLAVNNPEGNMELAVADTKIIQNITPEFIQKKHDILEKSEAVIVDANISEETLNYICTNYSYKNLFIDLVSTQKALKIKNIIGKFHTIKPNLIEAETLSGIKYNSDEDLPKMLNFFLNKNVKQVFITLGSRGCYYGNSNFRKLYKTSPVEPVNASGAGDAFISGIVYSFINNFQIIESVKTASAASIISLESASAVNSKMSKNYINEVIKKYNL